MKYVKYVNQPKRFCLYYPTWVKNYGAFTQFVLFSGFLSINWYQPTITQTVIFIFLQVAALNLYKNITAMSSPGKYE